jgi:hypothetical protein
MSNVPALTANRPRLVTTNANDGASEDPIGVGINAN